MKWLNVDTDQIKEGSEYKTKFSFHPVGNEQALKVSEQGSNKIKAVPWLVQLSWLSAGLQTNLRVASQG